MKAQAKLTRDEKRINRKKTWVKIKQQKYLYLLMLVPFVWYVIFAYLPLGGLVVAFEDFKFSTGLFGSKWVGLQNFKAVFTDYWFPQLMKNTVLLGLLKMVIGFPIPIIFALLLNELRCKSLKKVTQTVSYLPYFVSWVVVIAILRILFSVDGGLVNKLLLKWGWIDKSVDWLLKKKMIWPVAIVSEIWKSFGWSSIIYLAAISGIDPQLYEAAALDGAGRLRQMWSITLPAIKSTIIIILIMNAAGMLASNFDQMYQLNLDPVSEVAETIDTYIYTFGLKKLNYGFGTAFSIVRMICSFILISGANKIAKVCGEDGIW